jgi:hypothetical protein
MVFLFIFDVIASTALHIVVHCGYWIVCKSANGAYYAYNKITNKQPDTSTSTSTSTSPSTKNDDEYIVITREEYNRLKSECRLEF